MLSIRSFSVLCVITLCVSITAVLVPEDSGAIPGSGKPLFPDLMSRLNEVEQIRVEGAAERFALEKTESGWTVPDKFGYPADADKIHKLLVGAAGLDRVEPKTSNHLLYSKLGLADLSDESSKATSYRLNSGTEVTLASLLVGNSAPAKGDPDSSEFYVRLPGDPRVWLVEGKLPLASTLFEWVERTVISVDRARVREVTVEHASGKIVTVNRESPAEDRFRLSNAPASKTVEGQWKLNDIGRLFSDLELEDVRPRGEATAQAEPAYTVTMRTFDGLEVRMEVFEDGEQSLGVLEAGVSPEQLVTDAKAENAPGGMASLRGAKEVRAEAAALNSKWRGWTYVLPGYKVDAMARTHSELLKDLTAEKKPDQS